MNGLRISKDLSLPLEAGTWTFADLGIKDSGKTYDAGDLAEEFLKNGIPILVLDGMGIWWGLRIGADKHGKPDAKKPGMPVVVFGGDHRDLPIPTRLEKGREVVDTDRLVLMAKAILEAGISAVLDTSSFSKNMQRRTIAVFVDAVYHMNAKHGVRHVFIEEADMWCPQRGLTGDMAASTGAIDDLVRRGGNFNLGCTLITQRPAVLNKDVLTQASCLLVHRVVHDIDKKAVAAWVRSMVNPDDRKFKKWFDSLRGLENGEAYVWRPQKPCEINPPQRIKFRPRETVHASREFFRRPEAKTAKMGDVNEFIEKFKTKFEPKPKVAEKPKPTVEQLIQRRDESLDAETRRETPLVSTSSEVLTVPLTQPNVSVKQTLASFNVPLEPQSTMGRLLVVLYQGSDQAGNKRWTLSGLIEALATHGWATSEDELRGIIPTLLQTEHLTAVQSGTRTDYKFTGRTRVRILAEHPEVTLA